MYFLLFSIIIFSCKKEQDASPPRIIINQPETGFQTFSYGESVIVDFRATDNVGISGWTIRMVGPDGKTWYTNGIQSVADAPTNFNTNFGFPLDEIHAPSGTYSVGVFVQDTEGNEGASFRDITYFEAPLERERIVVVSDPSSNQLRLDTLSSGSIAFAGTLTGDASSICNGSFHRELILGGSETPSLRFIDSPQLEVSSSFDGQNPLGDVFVRDISFDPETKHYWSSFYDGTIREFRKNGVLRSSFNVPDNQQPEELLAVEDRILIESRTIGTLVRTLGFYGIAGGELLDAIGLDFDLVALLPYDAEYVIGFGNEGNSPIVMLINPLTAETIELDVFSSQSPINHVIHLTSGRYGIAQQEGISVRGFVPNTITPAVPNGINARHLSEDRTNGTLYAVDQNKLYALDPSSLNTIDQWDLPNNPVFVEVMHNK